MVHGYSVIELILVKRMVINMTEIEMMPPLRHRGTKTIKTERLTLRKFVKEDYIDMYKWASNPAVVKYLSYYPHKNPDVTKSILEKWIINYQKPNEYNWAIEFDGKCIGNISTVSQDNECFSCHLGWQIDVDFWNKGIMTEAAKAVVNFLFSEVGYDRITSGHDTRNIASGRVMQKIGMKLEGTFRRYCYRKDGSIGDKNYYAILKSDWESLTQNKLNN